MVDIGAYMFWYGAFMFIALICAINPFKFSRRYFQIISFLLTVIVILLSIPREALL